MDVEAIGTTLVNRYRLEAVLGKGGMGCVYLALDLLLDRRVAIKVIRRDRAQDAEGIARFIREAKVIAQLAANPHILTIYDLSVTEDHDPFIVTEYLRGRSWKALMRENERPSRSWVLDAAEQVVVGLSDVHRHGITHGDIKPSNLFIVDTLAMPLLMKVIDFGLSKSPQFAATSLGLASKAAGGTVRYLAPEVFVGQEITPASDIYALGITLFEIATGTYPYPATSIEETISAHRLAKPLGFAAEGRPFPDRFQSLVMTMLSKCPDSRPSAETCKRELRAANHELDRLKQ